MGQELLWTSAGAHCAPEDPFAFTVTEVLHSKRVLMELLIFSSPPDFSQDTAKHCSALIEKTPPGARPPGAHTLRYLWDEHTQTCRNE